MCIYYMDDNTRLDYIRGNGTGDLVDNFTLSTAAQIFIGGLDAVFVDLIVFVIVDLVS